MDFNEHYPIKNEAERVNKTYEIFNEEKRFSSKAGLVESIITVQKKKKKYR